MFFQASRNSTKPAAGARVVTDSWTGNGLTPNQDFGADPISVGPYFFRTTWMDVMSLAFIPASATDGR